MYGLLILIMASAVPMTFALVHVETKVEVQAEHPSPDGEHPTFAGNKLQAQAKGPLVSFAGCQEMEEGQLQYENAAGQTQLKGTIYISGSGTSIELHHKDDKCSDFEVRINILADPITVEASGSLTTPLDTFTLGDAGTKVEVKLEAKGN